jgi:hypothetical protein
MLGLVSKIKPTTEGYPQYRTRTSVTLDGNDGQYITAAGHADFQLNAVDFSVSGWVKFTADGTSSGFKILYVDETGDDERIYVYHYHASGETSSVSINAGSTVDWDHNIWYNIIYTYDASATTGKLYSNGVLIKTRTDVTTPDNIATSVAASIGTANAQEVAAKTCEIGFWKGKCLSYSQIKGIYNNGRPRNLSSLEPEYLKGYWRLNSKDATGSNNVIDYSGAGHHGTTASGGSNDLADSDFDTTDVPK